MFTTTVVLCMLAVAHIHAQVIPGGGGIDLTMIPGIAMGANGLDVAAGALRGRLALAPSLLPSFYFFLCWQGKSKKNKAKKKQSKKKAKQKKKGSVDADTGARTAATASISGSASLTERLNVGANANINVAAGVQLRRSRPIFLFFALLATRSHFCATPAAAVDQRDCAGRRRAPAADRRRCGRRRRHCGGVGHRDH